MILIVGIIVFAAVSAAGAGYLWGYSHGHEDGVAEGFGNAIIDIQKSG